MTADQQQQAEALEAGRKAEAKGDPVIYIHGRPYADPATDPTPDEHGKSPFSWDLWDE